jgi:hypothetical protein
MYDAIQERITDYEKEILQKLAKMEREECRGQEVPKSKKPQKGRAIQSRGAEPMRQALYRMSGVDLTGDRRDRGGNGPSRTQRIRARCEPFSHREAVRVACNAGAAQANERRQTGKKEEAEQREHSSCRCGWRLHRCAIARPR